MDPLEKNEPIAFHTLTFFFFPIPIYHTNVFLPPVNAETCGTTRD